MVGVVRLFVPDAARYMIDGTVTDKYLISTKTLYLFSTWSWLKAAAIEQTTGAGRAEGLGVELYRVRRREGGSKLLLETG